MVNFLCTPLKYKLRDISGEEETKFCVLKVSLSEDGEAVHFSINEGGIFDRCYFAVLDTNEMQSLIAVLADARLAALEAKNDEKKEHVGG